MKEFVLYPDIYKFKTFEEFVREFQIGKEDLVVTSKPIYETYLEPSLEESNTFLYEDYFKGEPSDEAFMRLYTDVCKTDYTRVVAIGGGSIIDVCKLLCLKQIVPLEDLYSKKIDIVKDKEFIAIPTTCGTGSEVTGISILEFEKKKTKMGLAVEQLYPNHAVLIPQLLTTLPYRFFATSAIDALVHAVESFINPASTIFSQMVSEKAISLIIGGFKAIAQRGEEEREAYLEDFLVAACLGGMAISNANTGAVHALSYPFSGTFHVPHGEANATFFIGVLKKYFEMDPENEKMVHITSILAKNLECPYNEVYEELDELLQQIIIIKPLNQFGMTEKQKADFTKIVIEEQQRLMQNTPVPMSYEDVYSVYDRLY